eukprot:CAMPEP_0119300980 /NCGR_PEP_ID=MMETSP1333-20130426/2859_1 /TAXON_ID=418940 /ORGANISM="Scyphosphaera apsteinii, Strain RCC1455" /LENGTH=68 /DNA_ID=CAMNT_0007302937 /DNA_START=848 /DNA_END=1054 /DNA_ORIENTATION=-
MAVEMLAQEMVEVIKMALALLTQEATAEVVKLGAAMTRMVKDVAGRVAEMMSQAQIETTMTVATAEAL